MVYQTPSGARDLLPLDVIQKLSIEHKLDQVFQCWGYHRIITSTVEHLSTLIAGGAIEQSTVIELQSTQAERLGLRPELTASIARAAVTRMADMTHPQRLYYSANVFRRADKGSHGGQQEHYQTGVELLGAGGSLADAEILLLLADCLSSLNLHSWHVVLGDAGLTQSMLLPFPAEMRQKVRQAIARLDRVAIEALPLAPALRRRALLLLDLRGRPEDILQLVSQLDLSVEQRSTVAALKSLIAILQETAKTAEGKATTIPSLVLDLSLLKPFDYYTGIVFEVVGDTELGRQVIGQGGRYDNLLGVFHPEQRSYPGIGFSLNIEALQQVLAARRQLPQALPAADWLVVPTEAPAAAAAFAYAQKIRTAANLVRVEVHLAEPTAPQAIRELARSRQISRIAWMPTSVAGN
ncbi:MAG: ATP phosphoribosyltransferase regulatory subunit [Leptolyngbyaceae cyanobacterium SM1_1_3]|nr:ATP phosphoribosyltransferase regulatory subunit [Leptolyngbyaceae cyanobacterium SM1_1_3]